MQDTVSVNNRPSRGTIIAEEGRKLCNNLSPIERQRLLQSAMAIIYGQKARDPILSAAYQQDNKPEGALKWP